jgi:hypothetical protein
LKLGRLNLESINKIIEDFAIKLVNDLRLSLKNKGVSYGGGQESRLAASIKYKLTYPKDDLKMDVSMNEYWKWVDGGRGTGPVPSDKILPWVKKKGIARKFAQEKKMPFDKASKSLAFLISRKIAKNGYKANHFFTEVINDGRQEILAQKIRQEYGKVIKNNLDTWQSQ